MEECKTDNEGRLVCVYGTFLDKKLVLCNVYAPNADNAEYFLGMLKVIKNFQNRDAIIVGSDFNLVLDPAIDRLNSDYNNTLSAEQLREIMEKLDLSDIWRVQNPDKRLFTWCRDLKTKNKISASRIDMFLISSHINDCVSSSNITPGHRTDHSFIDMDINLCDFKRGPGSWKLNNKILAEENYKVLIEKVISDTISNCPHMDPSECWCEIKIQCAKASKKYCKDKVYKTRQNRCKLTKLRENLLSDQLRNPDNADVITSLNQVESKLEQYEMYSTQASIFRSKCNWAEFGGKKQQKCSSH